MQLKYNFQINPISIIGMAGKLQGVPEKNETHFQFLITLKLFNP